MNRHKVSPTLQAVDAFCANFRNGLISGLPRKERFIVELLLREALTNAVVHGVKEEATGEVFCEIERFEGGITIRVTDSGPGFDWKSRLGTSVPSVSESGRGIEILRTYSTGLNFNAKGNRLEVTRVFEEGDDNV